MIPFFEAVRSDGIATGSFNLAFRLWGKEPSSAAQCVVSALSMAIDR